MRTRSMRIISAVLIFVLLCGIIGCSAHIHGFSNGICAQCGYRCQHDSYTDGVCEICGKECAHFDYSNGACTECGSVCVHDEYRNGVCIECGSACPHSEYKNGVCVECESACLHLYDHGVCSVCKTVCGHEIYDNGVCRECRALCTHEYVNGVCDICAIVCGHGKYENGICIECGCVCVHKRYNGGVCAECGTACSHKYINRVCITCDSEKPVDYGYEQHASEKLPRIDIYTVNAEDAPLLMTTASLNFDTNDLNSKNNRPYYACTVSVSNCDDEFVLNNAECNVKIRGNYTANYEKKPFRIKFDKKQSMLGLNDNAKLKNWVLLADYKDISMTRNTLAFWLGNMILGSDGYYCTDYRPVELYMNNEYRGMYLLAEHQQVNAARVDVTEPDDGYTGTDIGYMLEYDGYYNFESPAERFTCNYNNRAPLTVKDGWTVTPDQLGFSVKNDMYYTDENNCAQTEFIQSYINNLYKLCYEAVYNKRYYTFNKDNTALIAYEPRTSNPVRETVERVIDIHSLVDVYILNEIACDADIAWSSFCMDIDFGANGDRLLRFQAPWDFDSALGLKDSCANGTGWFAADSNNPWLVIFINEDWFWNEIKAKWREMQKFDVTEKALDIIRYGRTQYAEAYERNYQKWGFVKSGELNWEAQQLKNHEEAVEHLYNWFVKRINFLDSQWLRITDITD